MGTRKAISYQELKIKGFVVWQWRDNAGRFYYEVAPRNKPPNPFAASLISLPNDMVIIEDQGWTGVKYDVY